jgi:multisubunit Na+/H+ antiporter MnhF subunit
MGFIGAIVAYRLQREPQPLTRQEAIDMLWTLVVILVVLWALGLAFKVASGLIHLLLVVALVVVVFRLISGRRVV